MMVSLALLAPAAAAPSVVVAVEVAVVAAVVVAAIVVAAAAALLLLLAEGPPVVAVVPVAGVALVAVGTHCPWRPRARGARRRWRGVFGGGASEGLPSLPVSALGLPYVLRGCWRVDGARAG